MSDDLTFPSFPDEKFNAPEDNETAIGLIGLIKNVEWPKAKAAFDAMAEVRNAREKAKELVEESDAPSAQKYRATKSHYEKQVANYETEKAKAKEAYEEALKALEARFVQPEKGLKYQKSGVDAALKAAIEDVAADVVKEKNTEELAARFDKARKSVLTLISALETTGFKAEGVRLPTPNQAVSGRKHSDSSSGEGSRPTPRFSNVVVDGNSVSPSTLGAAAKVLNITRDTLADRMWSNLGAQQFTPATLDANGGNFSFDVVINEISHNVTVTPDLKVKSDESEEAAAA